MAIIGFASHDIRRIQRECTGSEWKVYTTISSFANARGNCHPSCETIAVEAGLCKRTVIHCTQALERKGLLNIERHPRPAGAGPGRGHSNLYGVVARWVKKVQSSFPKREGGRLHLQPSISFRDLSIEEAPPSGSRLLHLLGWGELQQAQEFLGALCSHYEENIGPLSKREIEFLETRFMLNDAPPEAVAYNVIAEAVTNEARNFRYVARVLDDTIKRGWIRDSRPGHKGYLRFRKSEWAVYRTMKDLRAGIKTLSTAAA